LGITLVAMASGEAAAKTDSGDKKIAKKNITTTNIFLVNKFDMIINGNGKHRRPVARVAIALR